MLPFKTAVTDNGVNFALYSANATGVTLLLFNDPGDEQPVRSDTTKLRQKPKL